MILFSRSILLALAASFLCFTIAVAASDVPYVHPSADGVPIVPFEIHASDSLLATLQTKLSLASFPTPIHTTEDETDPWMRGTSLEYLKNLVAFWHTSDSNDTGATASYDWRARERELNKLPHFKTELSGGYSMHFIHVRSPRSDAIPLIFSHGWPGSFLECLKVLPGLVDPSSLSLPAFHVVCPSIPGYGFSSLPSPSSSRRSAARTDIRKVAQLFIELMKTRLGYTNYVAQGGDWGSLITTHMASMDPSGCKGLHINMAPIGPPLNLYSIRNPLYATWRTINTVIDLLVPSWRFEKEEAEMVHAPLKWLWEQTGYFHLQSTRPDTIGLALHDSPVGLASWLVEKYRAWSDCHGDLSTRFSEQEILDHIMIYYITGSITSSMHLYYETNHPTTPAAGATDKEAPSMLSSLMSFDIKVPTAFAAFPAELARVPKKWMAEQFNLKQYTIHPRGGHFAAMEEPKLWLEDVQRFVRDHVQPTWKIDDTNNKQREQKEEL